MTQKNALDVKGTFFRHPFAELLVELGPTKLGGSLRLANGPNKAVVYVESGRIVHAVSNSKHLRLFNTMLKQCRIRKDDLREFPNFANDLEFALSLEASGRFTKQEIDEAVAAQIEEVIVDALTWPDGEWHFSPLARLRSDIRYTPDIYKVLINYARCLPTNTIVDRFRSVTERFEIDRERLLATQLQAHETYVAARFDGRSLTIEQLCQMSSLPANGLLQALYVLWLGGILIRRDWSSAFTPVKIGEIITARVVKVKEAANLEKSVVETPSEAPAKPPEPVVRKAADIDISLADYLARVEDAKTHYDTLGVENDADVGEIKRTYFGLAKLFHPDKFHRETADVQRRIQSAFTELAHAYETLKNSESREAYDFKMRKEIEGREQRRAAGVADDAAKADPRSETALQSFEQGLAALNDEDFDEAAMLLGRAVHYSPENAQFHAYYGVALSAFEKHKHKAESELQAAVRLAPKDSKIRMMLVDFLIEMNMKKRAIGELNRFLEIAPGNKDAVRRLAKLQP